MNLSSNGTSKTGRAGDFQATSASITNAGAQKKSSLIEAINRNLTLNKAKNKLISKVPAGNRAAETQSPGLASNKIFTSPLNHKSQANMFGMSGGKM